MIQENNPFVFGGFGKLPVMGEYLRFGIEEKELQPLRDFLERGMLLTRHELMGQWEQCYDNLLSHCFVFRPSQGQETFLGLIRAASDAQGRRYPFVAFARSSMALLDAHPLLAPTLQDTLYAELEQRMDALPVAGSIAEVEALLTEASDVYLDVKEELNRYFSYLEETPVGILGGEPVMGHADVIIADLHAMFASSESLSRHAGLVLEIPLHPSPYVHGLEIRFWIELCLLMLRLYPPGLSLFWQTRHPRFRPNSLFLCFKVPPGEVFAALLRPRPGGRGIWCPGRDQSPGGGLITRRVVEPEMSLRQVLEAVCPGYPSTCPWHGMEAVR